MNRKIIAILSIVIAVMSTVSLAGIVNAKLGSVGAVYTIDNAIAGNHVLYYFRASDGSLNLGGSVSTWGTGTGTGFHSQGAETLTQDGSFLLVVNAGSNSISVFYILGNGVPVFSSMTSSHGTTPISLTVNDNWVYVLNVGTTTPSIAPSIAGFTLGKTGMLTYIAGSKQSLSASSSPEQIGFNPNGNLLVVTEKGANIIDTFTVDWNGVADAPMAHASAGSGPYGFAFTDSNKLVVSEAGSGSASSYALSYEGNFHTISGKIKTGSTLDTPCWVAINDWGTIAYTANGGSGTITAYSLSTMGQLTLLSTAAATVSSAPALDLAFSAHSQFLYVLNGNGITGFKVYGDGSLSQVTSISSSSLASAAGLAAT